MKMCSESIPKEFEKTTEVLPFTKYGISTVQEFKETENELHHLEWLKKVGLSKEEIKLYQDNESGLLDQRQKIESSALKNKLEAIFYKINNSQSEPGCSKQSSDETNNVQKTENILERLQRKPIKFYPEGHPMNKLKEIEDKLFGHLKSDDIIPITKRRKILRRLERKKERVNALERPVVASKVDNTAKESKPNSLWDVKDVPEKWRLKKKPTGPSNDRLIGPKKPTMYTIKDNKIVRLEPVQNEPRLEPVQNEPRLELVQTEPRLEPVQNEPRLESVQNEPRLEKVHNESRLGRNELNVRAERIEEYQAIDIRIPINAAEEQLLEGTKMCVDDIRKIERFKDYEPGTPSKVLYLKNIAPAVTQEQLSLLFNQFVLDNGGPVDLRLMTGRMRGQAFVAFQAEDLAIQALDEINGTILSGRPIIAEFGRNSNRVQLDEDR